MCDESLAFWDFLNDKSETDRRREDKYNNENTVEEDEFWDYFEPFPSINQTELHSKSLEQIGKDNLHNPDNLFRCESESSRLHNEFNLKYHNAEGHKNTSNICLKPPVQSDDEFWDFLKCNTNEELQEVFENDATPQETPLAKDGSFDIHRRNPVIPIKKITDNKTEIRKYNYESDFFSTVKSSSAVDHNRSTSNYTPSNEKSSKISDDEFWDFLNSDSPVVGLNEVLQELPSYLNTAFSGTLNDSRDSHAHTALKDSHCGANFNLPDIARHSVESDKTIARNISSLHHYDNKNMQDDNCMNISKKNLNIQNRKNTKTLNATNGFKKIATNETLQGKEFQNKNVLAKNGSKPFCKPLIQNEMISRADQSGEEKIKLPCIATEFSISPYPDSLCGLFTQSAHQNSSSNESCPKLFEIISQKRVHEAKFRKKELRKSWKYRHSLTQSPLGCSQFNITDCLPSSILSRADIETANAPKNQNVDHQTLISNTDEKTIIQNEATFYPITTSTSSSVGSFEKSNNVNASKNFYLLLPQNQNSHFLVLLNNATESTKSSSSKNNSTSVLASSVNNDATQNQKKVHPENQDRFNNSVEPLNHYQVNNLQIKTSLSNVIDLNSEVANVGKQTTLDRPNINISNINLTDGLTQSINFQSFENFQTERSSTNNSNKNTSLLPNQNLTINNVSDSITSVKNIQSQKLFRNIKPVQTHSHGINTKPICSTAKQSILKPIKSISLGKDKHAIQQTSVPLKMSNIAQGKQLCDQQGNVTNYLLFSNNSSQSTISTHETIKSQCDKDDIDGQRSNANHSKSAQNHLLISTAVTMASNSTQIQDSFQVGTCNTATIVRDLHLQNTSAKDQDINKVHSFKHNVMSVPVLLNTTASISNNYNLKTQVSTSDNDKSANNYVQVKVAPSQQKSSTNITDLYQPPISMVPVCVMTSAQATQAAIQPTAQKVLVLKSFGQQNAVPQNVQPKRLVASQKITNNKKTVTKVKKQGRKTVRELLEERQQNISSHLGNKLRKELRVLRPVQKIASCSSYLPVLFSNNIVTATAGANGNVSSSLAKDVQRRDFDKRPNILMLPSARKTLKKNIIKDETICYVQNQKCQVDSPDFKISHQGKPNFRPRHYDMSELQIGYFHVDDDMDTCGRFRSKFKVIFSKRQFLYEFPVCQCNQIDLKSSDIWEQMVRIIVPFPIITSMNLSDRTIYLSINSTPLTCLGRIQARSGIISNATIYDKPIESYTSWDDAIKSSFNHKIVLRKRQVNKLKSVLYQFDAKFIALASIDKSQSEMNFNAPFDGELSPSDLKKNLTKNKKACIRRLPQWDSSEHEDELLDDDIEILKPQMCSCRISCRSVRCSCAKAAKSCSSVCICVNCGNPLNVLESIGINIEFSLKDQCLFQNIYRIPNLLDFLLREIKLSCCNTFARVQDCIPGTLLCPNIECNAQIEFSWCRVVVCYPERNPRNHCSFCGQCCFSNGQHCMTCNRCYVKVSSKFPHCPTCKEKPIPYNGHFLLNSLSQTQFQQTNSQQSSSSKSSTKPEIIILNAYSIPEETSFESVKSTPETLKIGDYSDDDPVQDDTKETYVVEQMDFEVQDD